MLSIFLAIALAKAPTAPADTNFSALKVGPKQSISWISLRHFGAFDKGIFDTLRMDNPKVPNWNKLQPGSTLMLRRSLDRRPLPPQRQVELASRKAVVTTMTGSGEVRRKDGTLQPLASNLFLVAGDEIRTTKGSSAEIVIDNQSLLRLRENSRLRLLGIQDTVGAKGGKAGTRVALDAGNLWVKVRHWAGPLVGFEVKLPSIIAGVHGTTFETRVDSISGEMVMVREGEVSVTTVANPSQSLRVVKGFKAEILEDGTLKLTEVVWTIPDTWPDIFIDPAEVDDPGKLLDPNGAKPVGPQDKEVKRVERFD